MSPSPHDAESYWNILGSDAAASVLTDQDKEEVDKTVEILKAQHSLAKQCHGRNFQTVKGVEAGKNGNTPQASASSSARWWRGRLSPYAVTENKDRYALKLRRFLGVGRES